MSFDLNNLFFYYMRVNFMLFFDKYDFIFDFDIKGYNGVEGFFKVRVNMGFVEFF